MIILTRILLLVEVIDWYCIGMSGNYNHLFYLTIVNHIAFIHIENDSVVLSCDFLQGD
jgi:hypothetical protein